MGAIIFVSVLADRRTATKTTKVGPAIEVDIKRRGTMRSILSRCILIIARATMASVSTPARAAGPESIGTSTGLRLPRYASLKHDRVNLREGPSKDHRTAWIFQRAGLPVEITAEYDTWRRIRDSEGAEGWVQQSLLSGRRTALIAPWKKNEVLPIRAKASDSADLVARLQTGVLANVRSCDSHWCRIAGEGFDGYIEQSNLWGVYPDEKL